MFEQYQDRKICFYGLLEVAGWQVKTYTISNKPAFTAHAIKDSILAALPAWLSTPAGSPLPAYNHAFLIIHEAREGVWVLLNWWTGGEMVARSTWFVGYEGPPKILHQPENDGLVCVWELEVLWHERKAWIEHVLQHPQSPFFDRYTRDVL